MRDMTQGKVRGHIIQLSTFIALTTLFQTLYFLVDLYFVGRVGKEAIAGVSLAGTVTFVVLALTQALGVGATSLIAQSLGRKDKRRAEQLFNQALVMSMLVGLAFCVILFAVRYPYAGWLAADKTTAALGVAYLNWYIPALFLQFVLVSMGAALRGLGDMKVPTMIQVGTVLINIVLAPVLILGWGTGRPLGVAGAALASFVAIAVGCVAFVAYFYRPASPLRIRFPDWAPELKAWWDKQKVGLPGGGEFLLLSVYLVLVYDIIRPFGAAAQAGFGIGGRVMQALFLPAVAIGFATAPVAGQNYGARLGSRVREAFYSAATISAVVMVALTAVCKIAPDALIRIFSQDAAVVAFGADYLRIISWNFLASGVIFVASSVFQGIGNTVPALFSSAMRLVLFAVPAYLLSQHPGFQMETVWYLSVGSVLIQLTVSVWLLHREFGRKLTFDAAREGSSPLPAG